MRFRGLIILLFISHLASGQNPNLHYKYHVDRMAIFLGDSQLCDYQFTELCNFSEGLTWAAKGDLYGYVDSSGKEVIPFQYFEATNFKYGVALVSKDSGIHFQLINKNGDSLSAHLFRDFTYFKDSLVAVQAEHHWGVINHKGELVVDTIYEVPPVFNTGHFITVKDADGYHVTNQNKTNSHREGYEFINTQGEAWRNGKKYWINLR